MKTSLGSVLEEPNEEEQVHIVLCFILGCDRSACSALYLNSVINAETTKKEVEVHKKTKM